MKLNKLNTKDNLLWKMSKYFTKNNDNKIPPLEINIKTLLKHCDKAEPFADHCEKVHYLTDKHGLQEHDD